MIDGCTLPQPSWHNGLEKKKHSQQEGIFWKLGYKAGLRGDPSNKETAQHSSMVRTAKQL